MKNNLKLKNFPISFFAPVLGFMGFALAFQKVESLFSLSNQISLLLLGVTIILFVMVLSIYGLKFLFHRKDIEKEYQHPVKINFFPLISKTLLVMSVMFLGIDMDASKYLWIVGVIINTIFSFAILGEWITKEHFKIEHMSPAWFIPVVGNLIIPIAGVQHFSPEISWFFFSAGVVWMFILTTIVLYRLMFHDPLPKKLIPTFFILFAAPAIAFIAYFKLTENFDGFAHILYYFATFLFFLIAFQWKLFLNIKFYISWWAYTFPLAAFSLATTQMYHVTNIYGFKIFATALLILLALFVVMLVYLTLRSISKREICIEEDE